MSAKLLKIQPGKLYRVLPGNLNFNPGEIVRAQQIIRRPGKEALVLCEYKNLEVTYSPIDLLPVQSN